MGAIKVIEAVGTASNVKFKSLRWLTALARFEIGIQMIEAAGGLNGLNSINYVVEADGAA